MFTTRISEDLAASGCTRFFAATAAPVRAGAYGRGRARLRPLLASTSLAALLIGVRTPAAFAQCVTPVGNQASVTNSVAINCLNISGITVTGNVTNTATGTITATGGVPPATTGITIRNSSIGGAVVNNGQITATGAGIGLTNLAGPNSARISGGITNAGTISMIGDSTPIIIFGGITPISTFGGGISNSGTISTGVTAHSGNFITNIFGISNFAGGISNSGTISAAFGGIAVSTSSTFAGGISNSGTISAGGGVTTGMAGAIRPTPIIVRLISTFTGGISNSGTISAGTINSTGTILTGAGIAVGVPSLVSFSTFAGGISNSGTITASGTDIRVLSVPTFLGNIANSGTITGENGILAGATGSGISMFMGGITNNGTITASGIGIRVADVANLTGNVANNGLLEAPTAIEVSNSNVTAFNNGTIVGNAAMVNGGILNMILRGGTWTGAALPVTSVTALPGSTWNVTADSTVTGTVLSGGLIQFTPPGPGGAFKTLTTMNYVGVGGTLGLNTFLGGDGSPSDILAINSGTAIGDTLVHITNTGGPGAETTANGILVVNAINGATTAPGAFALDNPELRAGAFDYRLFQGGLNGSDPEDWFLRSSFVSPEGPGPVEPGPEQPQPPPPVLPPGEFAIIGPELATYGVVQPVARELGLATLGTLHERIGDTLTANPCQAAAVASTDGTVFKAPVAPTTCASTGWGPSVWARGFGQQIRDHFLAFADPRADGSLSGFQSGIDLWRGSILPLAGHRDTTGVYFAYGNAAIDVNGLVTNAAATNYVLTKTGTVNFNAWSGGAYWTHYGPTDWYVDAVVQGTFYKGSAATQFASLPLNGSGIATSLESGYPIPLPWFGPRFALEPEAQIIWQRVSFDDTNDGLGPVSLGDTSGASGRIGLRGQWTIVSGEPVQPQTYQKVPTKAPPLLWWQVWQPYWVVNLWRDWGADASTSFAGEPVPLLSKATRFDLAAGLTARLSPNVSLYAQGGYQFAISSSTDGGQRDGVKGDLGLRYTW